MEIQNKIAQEGKTKNLFTKIATVFIVSILALVVIAPAVDIVSGVGTGLNGKLEDKFSASKEIHSQSQAALEAHRQNEGQLSKAACLAGLQEARDGISLYLQNSQSSLIKKDDYDRYEKMLSNWECEGKS